MINLNDVLGIVNISTAKRERVVSCYNTEIELFFCFSRRHRYISHFGHYEHGETLQIGGIDFPSVDG